MLVVMVAVSGCKDKKPAAPEPSKGSAAVTPFRLAEQLPEAPACLAVIGAGEGAIMLTERRVGQDADVSLSVEMQSGAAPPSYGTPLFDAGRDQAKVEWTKQSGMLSGKLSSVMAKLGPCVAIEATNSPNNDPVKRTWNFERGGEQLVVREDWDPSQDDNTGKTGRVQLVSGARKTELRKLTSQPGDGPRESVDAVFRSPDGSAVIVVVGDHDTEMHTQRVVVATTR